MDHIAEISGQEDHRQRGDNVGTVGTEFVVTAERAEVLVEAGVAKITK